MCLCCIIVFSAHTHPCTHACTCMYARTHTDLLHMHAVFLSCCPFSGTYIVLYIIHACTRTHTHARTARTWYVYCIVRHTCMHTCTHGTYTHTCTHIHARTHTCMHMHTRTHTHTLLYIVLCENCLLKTLHWRAVKRTHMPADAMSCLSLKF